MEKLGIIDIGSNSVRYMEAECTLEHVHSLFKSVHTTRLAEGQDQNHLLQDAPMRRTADIVNVLSESATEKGLPVFAYATSAVRDAANKDIFLSMIHPSLEVSVLSGDEEGRLAYKGATGGRGTLIDIGGGSMQVVTESISFSAPTGCVRFKEICSDGSPETLMKAVVPWADRFCSELPKVTGTVKGVGGTITTIGALLLDQNQYNGRELEKILITSESLNALTDRLFAMGEGRKNHPLLKRRHDIILHGCTLLHYLMIRLNIDSVSPCDRDGMEGFAESILAGYGHGKH